MKTLFTILVSLIVTSVFGQAPAIQWQKCFGGTGTENARFIQPTSDGGYIAVGQSASTNGDVTGNHGDSDYWVIKISSTGTVQWQKSLGGTVTDRASTILQTTDGGYIIAGSSYSSDGDVASNHGVTDYWIVKLSNTGVLQWQKSFGGSGEEENRALIKTTDGGYLIVGSSDSNDGDITSGKGSIFFYWILKLDSTGAIQWEKSFGGTSHLELANCAHQTSDGGYIIGGYGYSNDGDVTGNHGDSDYWIVKISSAGILQWQKSLGGSEREWAYSIQQTSDRGFIIAGTSRSTDGDVTGNHGGYDVWVVKVDSTGTLQWQKSLGGTGYDLAYSIQQTSDGGYILAGFSNSIDGDVTGNHGGFDGWIVKLGNTGILQWQKSLGGSGDEEFRKIQQTQDGGFIIAGSASSNNGDVSGNHGDSDYWVVKLGPDPAAVSDLTASESLSIYPNPATTELRIQSPQPIRSLTISDVTGRIVYQADQLAATEAVVPTATLPDGFYLLQAITGAGVATHKFQVRH